MNTIRHLQHPVTEITSNQVFRSLYTLHTQRIPVLKTPWVNCCQSLRSCRLPWWNRTLSSTSCHRSTRAVGQRRRTWGRTWPRPGWHCSRCRGRMRWTLSPPRHPSVWDTTCPEHLWVPSWCTDPLLAPWTTEVFWNNIFPSQIKYFLISYPQSRSIIK